MPKTGKTHFHLKGGRGTVNLRKGADPGISAMGKAIMKDAFALRFMGKSDDEIIEYLEEKYGRDLF